MTTFDPAPRGAFDVSSARDDAWTAAREGRQPRSVGIDALVTRILDAHLPGRGLQIVGTGLGDHIGAAEVIVRFSRTLSRQGRSILVDLNRAPARLPAIIGPEDRSASAPEMSGLSELLAGDASFAEVIHRDRASRLHFIPTGSADADFRDFDLVLDALSETYDFVVLLVPDLSGSEMAKVMAPYVDFVVLSAMSEMSETIFRTLEAEFVEAGARELMVTDVPLQHERHVA